eukprot:PhF_6_TR30752/c0_g1_i1/m.45282/K05770/TSPO, BZRP; benzodiazapine receptor
MLASLGLGRNQKSAFHGMEKLELYTTHLEQLRPWDRPPATLYKEHMTRQLWWHTNPPKLSKVMGYLVAFVVLCQVVAFLPLAVNLTALQDTWTDLKKPPMAYTEGGPLLAVWFFVHMFLSLAPWFVYISGGMSVHGWRLAPFGLLMAFESVWSDVFFAAKRMDWTIAVWCVMLSLSVVCMVLFWGAAKIATVFMVPYMCICAYGIVLLVYLQQLNGASYVRN